MIHEERTAMYQQVLDDIRKRKDEILKVCNPLLADLGTLISEERAIVKLMTGVSVSIEMPNTLPKVRNQDGLVNKKIKAPILSMLETGEFSVKEICEEIGIDQESYRGYFSAMYRQYKIGRRCFPVSKTYYYKYASEAWYKSQGIDDYVLHKNWDAIK